MNNLDINLFPLSVLISKMVALALHVIYIQHLSFQFLESKILKDDYEIVLNENTSGKLIN